MRYRLRHETKYNYSEEVTLCHNELRMTPRDGDGQRCVNSFVKIDPEQNTFDERVDFFGNKVVYFDVESPHKQLVITVESDIETTSRDVDVTQAERFTWEEVRDQFRDQFDVSAAPELRDISFYLLDSPLIPEVTGLDDLISACFPPGRSLLEASMALMEMTFREFQYDPAATTVATPLSQVVTNRRGVCQDFAHLCIAVLRKLGLAACYVSGYLETVPPPGQKRLRGADASHAWYSVYFPGIGWVDFDPTNAQRPNERYVIVARGRDYGDVSPLRGIVFGGGNMRLSVAVDVEPVEAAYVDSAAVDSASADGERRP